MTTPDLCTNCGHDWDAHDEPEDWCDPPPNPLRCPVEGCACWDVEPSPGEIIAAASVDEDEERMRKRAFDAAALAGWSAHTRSWDTLNEANSQLLELVDELLDALYPPSQAVTADDPTGPPTVAEIAALTAKLKHLSSPDATDEERTAFQAEKTALLARITDHQDEDR